MTTRRKSANIYDYPEHLNPFHEEDNHNRLRFWTVTKNKSRSNSFSFQSIKDFRGSIGRSFSIRNKNKNSSGSLEQTSQIENDEVQLRVSPISRQPTESYSTSTRLSVTNLPRSRFHERVRNSENPEPSKAEEKTESSVSTPTSENNPFNDESDEDKVTLRSHSPSKPVTPARKKKRAPPPPPLRQSSLKAKSLTDYKASKMNEEKLALSTQTSEISKEDIEHTENNVNIQIKVEEVTTSTTTEPKDGTTSVETVKKEETTTVETVKGDQITIETIVIESVKNGESTTIETVKSKETTIAESIKKETAEEESIKNENQIILKNVIPTEELNQEEIENKVEATKEDSTIEERKVENEENFSESVSSITEPVQISETTNEECINYNSELTLSSSHSSISSEIKLELLQHEAVQDTSDLLDLVNKLKMEVDKLTDDTNNNVIETEEEIKARNIQSWITLNSPTKVKTELNVCLDSDNNHADDDDDICTAPLSPRLVRLRKDSDWIRQNY